MMDTNQGRLIRLIEHYACSEGINATDIPSLFLFRSTATFEQLHTFYEPSVCFVIQGSKSVALAEQTLTYSTGEFLLVSVALPIISQVMEASIDRPHLALHINIDLQLVSELVMEMHMMDDVKTYDGYGLSVGEFTPMLYDAVFRLVKLLDTPQHIDMLKPLILREIFYLLLSGTEGAKLRNILVKTGKIYRVSQVIRRLREHFNQTVLMESLADEMGVSVSSLHHQFKAVTGITPLQFQKHLRLQEARRLMLGNDITAEQASFRVGYNSPSQFNREYHRMFGHPPMSDIKILQANSVVG